MHVQDECDRDALRMLAGRKSASLVYVCFRYPNRSEESLEDGGQHVRKGPRLPLTDKPAFAIAEGR